MMEIEKRHWYDGWFYDKLIAPNQDRLFGAIKSVIEEGSSVVDIGCGTGRLCFQLASRCNEVTGVDLSSKNIKSAGKKLRGKKSSNVKFIHANGAALSNQLNRKFDYAVITFMIHEIPPADRNRILAETKLVAGKLIIGDYLAPLPKGFWTYLNKAVEFAAGSDHYKNFNLFVNAGGLLPLLERNGYKILQEVKNIPTGTQLIIAV